MGPFQEYPKKMHHPQHAPAVWQKQKGTPAYEAALAAGKVSGSGLFAPDTVCTTTERFPDVVVTNLEQEKYHAARGYRPANVADPDAYEQAVLEAQPTSGYKHEEFPKWKYHALKIPVVVKSKQEELDLGKGWSDQPVIATEDDLVEAGTDVKEEAAQAAATSAVATAPTTGQAGAAGAVASLETKAQATVTKKKAAAKKKKKTVKTTRTPAQPAP